MPGYVERTQWPTCAECGGVDLGAVGFIIHWPTCSTQPGYEDARETAAEYKAQRRREIDELAASPEAKRLRELRTVSRLP